MSLKELLRLSKPQLRILLNKKVLELSKSRQTHLDDLGFRAWIYIKIYEAYNEKMQSNLNEVYRKAKATKRTNRPTIIDYAQDTLSQGEFAVLTSIALKTVNEYLVMSTEEFRKRLTNIK